MDRPQIPTAGGGSLCFPESRPPRLTELPQREESKRGGGGGGGGGSGDAIFMGERNY